MSRPRRQSGVLAAALLAGCFYLPPPTSLSIVSPQDGSQSTYNAGITFEAKAVNPMGLKSLELDAGGINGVPVAVLSVCRASGSAVTTLDCQAAIIPVDRRELLSNGMLSLTATAVTISGAVTSKTITVSVEFLRCSFDQPALTAGSDPPEADVSGEDAITVNVTNAFPISEVVVRSDAQATLTFWNAAPFTAKIDWCALLGEGVHGLTVTCDDQSGNSGSDNRQVNVHCTSPRCSTDAQCHAPTPRCDTTAGQCVQCSSFSDCPSGDSCIQDICVIDCTSDLECPSGEFCDPTTFTCASSGMDAGL
jgi:Cys-rich repeat protein